MKYLKNGAFCLENFSDYSSLYFPLCNHAGLKGAITPDFLGDLKTDQHHFSLPPASAIDLLNVSNARNVWFKVNGEPWSITGHSVSQYMVSDKTKVTYGFLYQKVNRTAKDFSVEITSFVPEGQNVELHKIVFKNNSQKVLNVKPYIAVPLYSRSADNIRDHRHVTSLLNRVSTENNIVINKPTLSFDERGHVQNDTYYYVCASNFMGHGPINYYTDINSFIGEGGNFFRPKAVYEDIKPSNHSEGFEALGGMAYEEKNILPGDSFTIVFGIGISKEKPNSSVVDDFDRLFEESQKVWQKYFNNLSFNYSDTAFSKWVTLQPVLRRIYGCSFLPHHDYGKGGRGWRDLWQDSLALLKMDTVDISKMLVNNFMGTRIDGSNATIIGDKDGEFKADRNGIPRMWMDHGVWPFITTSEYISNTNNIGILFEEVPYFKDSHIAFSRDIDNDYTDDYGLWQKDIKGNIYKGSILEHILLQNYIIMLNVGKHNTLRLMGADWNDAFDMASKNGESVTFTALYAKNLLDISNMLEQLNVDSIIVFEEFANILNSPFEYENIAQKHELLYSYFNSVMHNISGKKTSVKTAPLIEKFKSIYNSVKIALNTNEWVENSSYGYFNGYYDDDSNPLDNIENKDMLLTSQVFPLMAKLANDKKVDKLIDAANDLLFDKYVGGYKLNTKFDSQKLNMGRAFSFAYGHKENGAVFSHMTVMFANALYKNNKCRAGYNALQAIINKVYDFESSKTFLGVPEYFDIDGRGMYHYLTGSASWFLLTLIDEVFGVKRNAENVLFEPKLVYEQFVENTAGIRLLINNLHVDVIYHISVAQETYKPVKTVLDGNVVDKVDINDLKENSKIDVYLD